MKFNLYIDMDGVLADFDEYVTQANGGVHPDDDGTSVWKHIKPGSFEAFPMMHDAHILWDYVNKFDPTIMTATGHSVKTVGAEKSRWAMHHLGWPWVFTCQDGKDKIRMIDHKDYHRSILVDDRAKAIDPWVEAGAIGILHISATETIEQLKKILEK